MVFSIGPAAWTGIMAAKPPIAAKPAMIMDRTQPDARNMPQTPATPILKQPAPDLATPATSATTGSCQN
jgi:hypothetical protein